MHLKERAAQFRIRIRNSRFGMGMPLDLASSFNASKKLMRSISMTNLKMSPPNPAAKALVELDAWHCTLNDGVFSVWNGHRPR